MKIELKSKLKTYEGDVYDSKGSIIKIPTKVGQFTKSQIFLFPEFQTKNGSFQEMPLMLDTGASVSVIPEEWTYGLNGIDIISDVGWVKHLWVGQLEREDNKTKRKDENFLEHISLLKCCFCDKTSLSEVFLYLPTFIIKSRDLRFQGVLGLCGFLAPASVEYYYSKNHKMVCDPKIEKNEIFYISVVSNDNNKRDPTIYLHFSEEEQRCKMPQGYKI